MSDTNTTGEQLPIDQWLQIRNQEGLKLNEETATVMRW